LPASIAKRTVSFPLSFVVHLASSGLNFVIPADKTIAEVLLDNGVDVPLPVPEIPYQVSRCTFT